MRVGKNGWTLPLPLIKTDAGWRFDVAKGKEEMTNRRVGYNELSAIEACKAYVAAQDEYFKLDRDGNGLREYARRFISTPGTHDGLYWPPENQADISPLDGFAEDANLAARSGEKPEPYNGYYFRILTAQGPAAPGGAFSYLINGHMIAGHAMVAWPAAYGDSGVETFICGENGVVYQKDLGPNTAALGASMAQYNPDASWIQANSCDFGVAAPSRQSIRWPGGSSFPISAARQGAAVFIARGWPPIDLHAFWKHAFAPERSVAENAGLLGLPLLR